MVHFLQETSNPFQLNNKWNWCFKETVENIQTQLKQNGLNITELDDNRNWLQKITHDPLKSVLISPLNWGSKSLGLQNNLLGGLTLEIIFKLVIIEIVSILVCYSETSKVWENLGKMNDPYISNEEKQQLYGETMPLFKCWIFNGLMWVLLTFFLY